MVFENILDAIGGTPIVKLQRMPEADSAEILVKVEALNVGGSIKTRTAYNMLREAAAQGILTKDSIICEPTSGNQGIGIALVGAVCGYRVEIVMPDSVSEERRKLIAQYGAKVILVHDDGDIGKCIAQCLEVAQRRAAEDPNVYIPQQFVNPHNPKAHRDGTGREILEQVGAPIHGFCSGIGTGGTISGVGQVLREKNPDIEIWAVEPEKAAILSGGPIGSHLQMGIGDGLIPENLDTGIYSHVCVISDEEAIETARRLAREEGLLCGISSGTNVAAALRLAKKLGPSKRVVTILPDTGERYFSTPLFEP
ncbi:MAG TPA: cysteine synthase A [Candidatus Galloscillospira excrementipullorum]|nr:cysteine synthase A [Candidatus Galloscillospira excrementipullorum]